MTIHDRTMGLLFATHGGPKHYFAPARLVHYGGLHRRQLVDMSTWKGKTTKQEHTRAATDPLAHIRKAIEAARCILDLEPDWDGEGSAAYDPVTFNAAVDFLAAQAGQALAAKVTIPAPDIAPGPNGSIDLVWQEPKYRLLINVPHGGRPIGYWGRNSVVEIKGQIHEPSVDHKELFLWLMKTL
ncbi:hypothetical protein [Polyangium sp. 15x6]|uniref:hypothetical protein n=1 Tax=Polyangium sp. 15x6 TaxID=3042687 RepID=UPI00249B6C32|nr:hypothetical protein [Polyangium sp. 15x6]MDI3287791.1 hypothetical protein [Polyangium sp. 15x6]